LLDSAGLEYEVNPRLVRGLDYYSKTVFEWVTDQLGAQGTICAGGRYDGLVQQLGGRETPAAGFAMGIERLLALLEDAGKSVDSAPDIFVILQGDRAQLEGQSIVESIRDQLTDKIIQTNCGGGSFKSQFKKADKSGARIALLIGEDEINNHTVSVKPLREDTAQTTVALDELVATLKSF